jgi:hypothetical protein
MALWPFWANESFNVEVFASQAESENVPGPGDAKVTQKCDAPIASSLASAAASGDVDASMTSCVTASQEVGVAQTSTSSCVTASQEARVARSSTSQPVRYGKPGRPKSGHGKPPSSHGLLRERARSQSYDI